MCTITGPFSAQFKQKVRNCSGAVGSGNALSSYWADNDCPDAYSRVMNTSSDSQEPNPILKYNPAGQLEVQSCVNELFDTYLTTKSLTDDITSPQFDPFQNTLLELCIDDRLPGVCEKFLEKYCGDKPRVEAIGSPVLTNFCGCYVPPDPVYLKYTTPPTTGQPACDPLCHRALTSQKADHTTGQPITCTQNICVLDNIIIQGSGNTINGGINFNSICAGCGAPPPTGNPSLDKSVDATGSINCLCIVSGINIADTLSNVGIGDNLNTFCGTNSVCIVEDSQGNILSEGPCTGSEQITVPTFSSAPSWWLVFLIVLIVIVILLVCVAVRYA